jgi:hypothetical protein
LSLFSELFLLPPFDRCIQEAVKGRRCFNRGLQTWRNASKQGEKENPYSSMGSIDGRIKTQQNTGVLVCLVSYVLLLPVHCAGADGG